jgi:hypothetical protein
MTLETVATDTPALNATSSIVAMGKSSLASRIKIFWSDYSILLEKARIILQEAKTSGKSCENAF